MINYFFDWLISNIEENKLCWYSLSVNPNITWDLIKKHIYKPWNWYLLAKHPNITWDIIKNNSNKPWYNTDTFYGISENPNITWDIIINNLDFLWSWKELSCHQNITFEIIKNNLHYDWSWEMISYNPNITWEHIFDNPTYKWNLNTLIYNKNIYWDIINNNENIMAFLKNKYKNIDYIFDNLDWLLMSSDTRLNIDTITKINKVCHVTYKQKNNNIGKTNEEIISSCWYKQQLSLILDPEEILKLQDLFRVDYFILNRNINLDQLNSIIQYNNNISFELSQCPLLDLNFFKHHEHLFNSLGYMLNPNIDINYIKSVTDYTHLYRICSNTFNYDYYYISKNYKKNLVKQFINNCWEELIQKACHPSRLFNWNEDMKYDYSNEYNNEYLKYKI